MSWNRPNPILSPAGLSLLTLSLLAVLTVFSALGQGTVSTNGLELANPAEVLLFVDCRQHAISHGITSEMLRSRMEAQLNVAGIRCTNIANVARLEVEANSDSTGTNFSLALNFRRPVTFEAGGRAYRTDAITWSRSMLFNYNQQTNVVLAVAEMLTKEFVEDHKKANPSIALRGNIVATDPKYQFVILNIGAKDGVKDAQEFAVERKGETIAVIRVTSVKVDHSVGNILQTPPPQDILEGDVVFPRR